MRGSRALAALGVAGLVLSACRGSETGIEALAAKLGERRRVEPRLTGGFAHAPCLTDRNAADLVPDPRCSALPQGDRRLLADLLHIAKVIHTETEKHPKPAALQAHGLADLVLGQKDEELERAVAMLEQAAAAAPRDARILSDLSAAYLVRAQRDDDPLDLVRGLSAANRALRERERLPEARFNRALALQLLCLESEALAAWDRYLEIDHTSAWAAEAESRRAALQEAGSQRAWGEQQPLLQRAALAGDPAQVERIVRRHYQAAGEWAELQLLGAWADAAAKQDSGSAARWLETLRSIGAAIAAVSGDRLILDSVSTIDEASRIGDDGRLRTLVRGHLAFQQGHALYRKREPGRAAARLSAARQDLARAGSPFAARAAFFLACSDNLQSRYARSLAVLEQLERELMDRPYPGLLGHIAWMEALNLLVDGQVMSAVEAYGRSLAFYRRTGEIGNTASVESLLAQGLGLVGRRREAWEHLYRALRSVQELRDPGLRSMVFMIAGDAALQEGEIEASLLFQDEVVRQASASNPTRQAETRIWRAMTEDRLGRRDLALADLQEAGRQVRLIRDPVLNRRKRADLAMAEGALVLEREPRKALPLLAFALQVYQGEENHVFSLRVHRLRARAHRLAGDDGPAEQDLRAGLAEYERLGRSLSGAEELRLAFLEETEEVFDEMISFQADRQPDLAFAYADRARTRVLPGSASQLWVDRADTRRLLAAEPRSLGLTEIRRQLPEKTTLIQYSVLDDRVLVWLLQRQGRSGTRFFMQRIPRAALERRVRTMRSFHPAGAAAWREASTGLFDLLVRPWLAEVAEGERLVFVPDKALHALPFACLVNGKTGRYLIQDHEIAVSPSATLYVNALGRNRRWAASAAVSRRALVVGDPAFDRNRFPHLVSLPRAIEESARIAALYGIAPLQGAAADRERFLAEAARAEWIHFAGHSVVDPQNPLLSMLVLARGSGDETGALYAREIYPLDLRETRLVVLAACDTGAGYSPGSEGVSSFARAFFAAGVPTVVASLWKVEDEITGRLFYAFHQNLLAHHDPARALREAQLSLLASRDEKQRAPTAWGAFEVIGASAQETNRKGV